MQHNKLKEACQLSASANELLREHPCAQTASPENIFKLHTLLRDLLPCIVILESFETCPSSSSPLTPIYSVTAKAIQEIVEHHMAQAPSMGIAAPAPPLPVHGSNSSVANEAAGPSPPTPSVAPLGTCGGSSSNVVGDSKKGEEEVIVQPLSTKLRWSDVHGCDEAISVLKQAMLLPKRFPTFFQGARKPLQRLLLYGPPGTGKTLLACATAGEQDAPFLCLSSADLLSKWVGESEKHVRMVFQQAALYPSCVLFLDEIDALCGSRGSHGETEVARRLKTEFLLHLQALPPSVTVMAATNLPWEIDAAIRRRFERCVYVGLPNSAARRTIIVQQLVGIDHCLARADVDWAVRSTSGFSASDVVNVMAHAITGPLRDLMDATALRLATRDDLVRHGKCAAAERTSRPLNPLHDAAAAAGASKRKRQRVSSECGSGISVGAAAGAGAGAGWEARSSASPPPAASVETVSARLTDDASRLNKVSLRSNKRKRDVAPDASSLPSRGGEQMLESAASSAYSSTQYYVPCRGTDVRALPRLVPAHVPAGSLLLPIVTPADVKEAVGSFIPSVSKVELQRFDEWRHQMR